MSSPIPAPPPRRDWSLHLGFVWAGLVLFVPVSFAFLMLNLRGGGDPVVGLLFAVMVLGIAALAYWWLRWRGSAIGLAAGYLLMTLVSGGTCTGWRDGGDGYAMVGGAVLYVLAVLIFTPIAAAIEVIRYMKGR